MFIEDVVNKMAILILFIGIFVFCIKNIKAFILVYIASRSLIAIFYDVDIALGMNIIELASFLFPVILLLYWMVDRKFEIRKSSHVIFFSIIVFWVLFSTLISILHYGFRGIISFESLMKILNGFSVFIVFPLIFKDKKGIESLMNAIFIMTLFPLLQGLIQIFMGSGISGMDTSISRGDEAEFEMYFGLYHKYGWYANAALFGALFLIYKIGTLEKKTEKKAYLYYLMFVLYLILGSITLSRTLFIGLVIIVFFIIINQKSKIQKAIFLLILILFIGGGFFQARYKQLARRSESEIAILRGNAPIEHGLHGRVTLWKYKLKRFNQYSFFERLIGTDISTGPHGDYVQWILSYGYVGVTLYILFILKLLSGSIKMYRGLKKKKFSYLNAYGLMVIVGLFIWILEGVIHNSSQMPDYYYVIIGNAAIFLTIVSNNSFQDNHSTRFINSDNFELQA